MFAVQEFAAESASAPVAAAARMFAALGPVMAFARTEASASASVIVSPDLEPASPSLSVDSVSASFAATASATALAAFAETSFSAEALPTATELSEVAVFLFGLELAAAVSALVSATASVHGCSAFGHPQSERPVTRRLVQC